MTTTLMSETSEATQAGFGSVFGSRVFGMRVVPATAYAHLAFGEEDESRGRIAEAVVPCDDPQTVVVYWSNGGEEHHSLPEGLAGWWSNGGILPEGSFVGEPAALERLESLAEELEAVTREAYAFAYPERPLDSHPASERALEPASVFLASSGIPLELVHGEGRSVAFDEAQHSLEVRRPASDGTRPCERSFALPKRLAAYQVKGLPSGVPDYLGGTWVGVPDAIARLRALDERCLALREEALRLAFPLTSRP